MKDYLSADWPAPINIKAYTTLRNSWGNNDHKSTAERQLLTNLLNLPSQPIWLQQTHSNIALEAKPEIIDQEADAAYTRESNRVCVVVTADCLPILLTNKQGTEVAAIHAGWRSLASGVIENTLHQLTSKPEDLLVWLGPAIGKQKFEVGIDVYDAFTCHHPAAAKAFMPYVKDKWFADIYTLAKLRLADFGITAIYGGNFCTFTQVDLFYSYRRDKQPIGRMASAIWINN